jgi:hypothetical protein
MHRLPASTSQAFLTREMRLALAANVKTPGWLQLANGAFHLICSAMSRYVQ